MRKIKFRGKRIDNGEWIYGNLIKNINEDTDEVRFFIIRNPRLTKDCGCCDSCECDYNCVGYIIEIKEETVGELTGLKDCIGKEIYEGDMIKISDSDMEYFPEDGEDFIVKWFKDCCGFWIWHIESNRWWDGDMNPFSYEPEIEIIGNIYENPELIK